MKSNQSFISLDSSSSSPQAVVLLLGWWGSKMRHVQKYSELYHERDCDTVTAIVDPKTITCFDLYMLDDFARQVASDVAEKVRFIESKNDDKAKKIPVLTHAFSNGGVYPLWRLEVLIERARMNQGAENEASHQLSQIDQDLLLVGDRLQVQLFDSSPCFPHTLSALKAMDHAISNPMIRQVTRIALLVKIFFAQILRLILGTTDRRMDFWKAMKVSRLAPHHAYVYSPSDEICDVELLEELIDAKKQQHNSSVTVQKFDDSDHVQHVRKYPKEYNQLLDDCLDKARSAM